MTTSPPPDLNALAVEALELWQQHLAALAADPKAKAELVKVMEPSRCLFAEWMEKVQNAPYGTAPFQAPASSPHPPASDGAAAIRPASDDGALRLAQLTLHVAELEKRVSQLESRRAKASARNPKSAAKRT